MRQLTDRFALPYHAKFQTFHTLERIGDRSPKQFLRDLRSTYKAAGGINNTNLRYAFALGLPQEYTNIVFASNPTQTTSQKLLHELMICGMQTVPSLLHSIPMPLNLQFVIQVLLGLTPNICQSPHKRTVVLTPWIGQLACYNCIGGSHRHNKKNSAKSSMTWTWITVTSPTLRPEITLLEIPISKATKSLSDVINHSTTTALVLIRLQAIRVLSHLQLTINRVCAITTHPSEPELESATKKIVVGFSSKSLSILARNIPVPGKSITKILRKTNLMWYYKKHYHMRTLKSSLPHRHQLQTFLSSQLRCVHFRNALSRNWQET